MFWFILAGIIAFCLVVAVVVDEWDFGEPGIAIFFGFLFGSIGAFLAGSMLNLLGAWIVGDHSELEVKHELLALSDTTGPSGSFFLGTGSVNEEASFFYYEKLERGAHLTHVDADDAIIIEESDLDEPYVDVLVQHSNNTFWFSDFIAEDESYEFHIPKGSIATNYSLDAE